MTTRRHSISTDADLHPDLAESNAELRGGMVEAAEKVPLPARFTYEPHPDVARMIVTDLATGKTSSVALCDWFGVRQTLSDFFAE